MTWNWQRVKLCLENKAYSAYMLFRSKVPTFHYKQTLYILDKSFGLKFKNTAPWEYE